MTNSHAITLRYTKHKEHSRRQVKQTNTKHKEHNRRHPKQTNNTKHKEHSRRHPKQTNNTKHKEHRRRQPKQTNKNTQAADTNMHKQAQGKTLVPILASMCASDHWPSI
jgi:TPP-dependent indolepyruvate ferredoxin oxidoreductase alpha subunit